VAVGLSIAATATVARRIGEKDRDGAAVAGVQVIALGVAIAVPLGIVGALFAKPLLAAMGAEPATIETGAGYTQVMLGGNATVLLLWLINAVFRGAGDAAIAMRTLWLANGLNLILDPCFIYGWGPFPEMGVMGAAVATNIGRGTGVLYQLWQLSRPQGHLEVRRRHLAIQPAQMLSIVRMSGIGIVQMLISTTSYVGLLKILARFGDAALAGYGIAIRIVIFALLPTWGMSNAAATLVGQNLGAKHPDRAEKSVWLAGFYSMLFLTAIGVFFVLGAPWIVSFFTTESGAALQAVDCLRIVSYGFVFYAYGMVLVQAFNGAGDTWTPTLINFFIFWLFEVPLALLLSGTFLVYAESRWPSLAELPLLRSLDLGPRGVYLAIMIAFSAYAIVGALLFKRGRWKLKHV
jgi:putative MATE family efflux protein